VDDQLAHSVPIGEDGEASDPESYLAHFLALLREDWGVVD